MCGFWNSLCEMPGYGKGHCYARCQRPAGHTGRCACGVHLDDPFAAPVPRVQLLHSARPAPYIRTGVVTGLAGVSLAREVQRSDHPPVYAPARASRAAMAQALATQQQRDLAIMKLKEDIYARSSTSARSAAWSTWKFAAGLWGLPPLPVTLDSLEKVAAALKAGRYTAPSKVFTVALQQQWRCTLYAKIVLQRCV